MSFSESLLFYLVIGAAVAAAYATIDRQAHRPAIGFALVGGCLSACLFWPLFLPLVLTKRSEAAPAASAPLPPADELAAAIEQVERELDAALAGLDGWAENVLNRNSGRLAELRSALTAQVDRIRSMDALLAKEQSGDEPRTAPEGAVAEDSGVDLRQRRSRQARRENMDRLAEVCRRSRADMLATFAWIRELVSMIHLAKFTGAPAARAEELVAQIAAAVESLSMVSSAPNVGAAPFTTPSDRIFSAPTLSSGVTS